MMEWWLLLIILFGGLFLLMASGMPVAFGFALINLLAAYFILGGKVAFYNIILSMSSSTMFALITVPLFVLMGEILWHSGIGMRAIDVLDKWLGRMPGRVSILAVVAGVIFAGGRGCKM